MISLRKATLEDAIEVASLLRPEDAAEMIGLGYPSAEAGVVESVKDSVEAWVVGSKSGVPLAIVGYAISNVISNEAHPWLVTTRHVEKNRMEFARASRGFINTMREDFALLENWVDARYTRCVEWLTWLGFEIEPAAPIPPTQMLFHRFTMKGTA